MEGVTEGRIVHYVLSNGDHRAAIIARVFAGGEMTGVVNLYVFLDGENDKHVPHGAEYAPGIVWATSAHYDEAGDKEHTWHWPERV